MGTRAASRPVPSGPPIMAEGRIVGYVPPAGVRERTRLLRLKVIAGHNLAKKDIFGASDPYLRIDLVRRRKERKPDRVATKDCPQTSGGVPRDTDLGLSLAMSMCN